MMHFSRCRSPTPIRCRRSANASWLISCSRAIRSNCRRRATNACSPVMSGIQMGNCVVRRQSITNRHHLHHLFSPFAAMDERERRQCNCVCSIYLMCAFFCWVLRYYTFNVLRGFAAWSGEARAVRRASILSSFVRLKEEYTHTHTGNKVPSVWTDLHVLLCCCWPWGRSTLVNTAGSEMCNLFLGCQINAN